MDLNTLTAISPVDGRYRSKTGNLDAYFSEYALIRYRVRVEVEYFLALRDLHLPGFDTMNEAYVAPIRHIYTDFSEADALRVKEIEAVTNHDVKAVEYFIKEKFEAIEKSEALKGCGGLLQFQEFVHFGLTSQDINNTAVPLSIKEAFNQIYAPVQNEVTEMIGELAGQWKDIPMLAHTHGQPASPTRLGKEFYVFYSRLTTALSLLNEAELFSGKFGGATGNFNAHHVAYPGIDWSRWASTFLHEKLDLKREPCTTQISNYDNLAAFFDSIRRVNTILIDLCRDVWQYISMGYFRQRIKAGEVGSSAMPHKVNPIDFENAEGNLGIANALLAHLSQKLPISRMQRDLTDSTVLRNVGVPLAHGLIALESIKKGLRKLELNEEALRADLDRNWAVVAEGIQTILRREHYPKPYETLKALTRTGKPIRREDIQQFIDTLDVSEQIRRELHAITPDNYLGEFSSAIAEASTVTSSNH